MGRTIEWYFVNGDLGLNLKWGFPCRFVCAGQNWVGADKLVFIGLFFDRICFNMDISVYLRPLWGFCNMNRESSMSELVIMNFIGWRISPASICSDLLLSKKIFKRTFFDESDGCFWKIYYLRQVKRDLSVGRFFFFLEICRNINWIYIIKQIIIGHGMFHTHFQRLRSGEIGWCQFGYFEVWYVTALL